MVNKSKTKSIDTTKLFIFNLPHFIKYLFGGQVLPIIGILSLANVLMPINVIFHLFVYIITISMAYKFSFDVLADTARGNMSPTVRQNYLVTNVIVVKVLIVGLLIEIALWWMNRNGYSEQERFYLIAFSAFITPAIYMGLALTNSLLIALNPIHIFKIIKATHVSYLLFVVFWISTISLHEFIINPFLFHNIPIFVDGVVSTFIEYSFLVLNFQIMGYIIFQKRTEFDLEGIGFQKIEGDIIETQVVDENPIYTRIKMLLVDDEVETALAMVVELQKGGDMSAKLGDLFKQAMEMKLYSPTNLDIAHKIHNRLNKNQNKKAFDMVIEHLDSGEEYVEISPEDINQLINHAVSINKANFIAPLVKGFHEKYPYHADIVPNYFVLAKSLYNDRETRNQSKEMLIGIIRKYPHDTNISEIKAWLRGAEMMSKK